MSRGAGVVILCSEIVLPALVFVLVRDIFRWYSEAVDEYEINVILCAIGRLESVPPETPVSEIVEPSPVTEISVPVALLLRVLFENACSMIVPACILPLLFPVESKLYQ